MIQEVVRIPLVLSLLVIPPRLAIRGVDQQDKGRHSVIVRRRHDEDLTRTCDGSRSYVATERNCSELGGICANIVA